MPSESSSDEALLDEVARILAGASRRGPFGLRTGPWGWVALAVAAVLVTCTSPMWWWPAGGVGFVVAVWAIERCVATQRFAVAYFVEQLHGRITAADAALRARTTKASDDTTVEPDAQQARDDDLRRFVPLAVCGVILLYVTWWFAPAVFLALVIGLAVLFTYAFRER